MDDLLIREISDDLIRIQFSSPATGLEQCADLLAKKINLQEVVCGIDNITVKYDCLQINYSALEAKLEELLSDYHPSSEQKSETIIIPICYAPEYALDHQHIKDHTNLDLEQIVDLHLNQKYQIQQIGFLPGFAYCSGGSEALNVPRLSSPRQHVPAGSIGIAGRQTGIYSVASPGGWSIIGRTPLQLFKPHSDKPFHLQSGMKVEFKQITPDVFLELQQELQS